MKLIKRNLAVAVCIFELLFFSQCVFSADEYVALNSAMAKKCGIKFNHPKYWKMFFVEPNDPEDRCIIAYRNLKIKHSPPPVALADGWREVSDGGFVFKNIPVTEQFDEFDFQTENNGKVNYFGHSSPRFSTLKGYKPVTVDSINVIKQGGGILYVGHAHYSENKKAGGKIVTTQINRVDLLFGNESISIGNTYVEADIDSSIQKNIVTFEKIFKSMGFVENTE